MTPRIKMLDKIPKFSELPLNPHHPPWSAWGLYGEDDQIGTVNRLTDDLVQHAATAEIRTGERFSLNWELNALGSHTMINRQSFEMKQWNKAPRVVNDDVWTFNSQASTQWDGLRHFAYQKEKMFYNGRTLDDFFDESGKVKSTVNGIEQWQKKGIVGRGILVDYDRWRRANGKHYQPLATTDETKVCAIPLEDLKSTLAWQGTEVRFGDILIIRTGATAAYNQLDDAARKELAMSTNLSGIEQSEAMLEWIWSNFSAIAADNTGIERWPSQKEYLLHEVLLSGWGMPFGEFFQLEDLAEHCLRQKRWSFFFVSEVNISLYQFSDVLVPLLTQSYE